ncbi:AraC family transcriptional regulator [Methylobacterium sp. PvP062]|jgi:AraC family transcriptional regulator|uniref:Transcriptional regulator, AraC family n=2 Tax=Methylobacterium radiotolerans TaxID=31998 RepID=B1M724_METRJ|nr:MULTISPECIES: AraC family transcriptional regulator [Methylobacterium]MCX7335526.1 AraC family transcriptional regulator [Hyphomicrobiales bacterium]GAN47367.1 AraC family transcriptional regulator [Methylobacterium sp. ME121]ACB26683.1 transcriptional regulator, AraC family [Methylobacterium radiotolerans JCM 2831]MBN6823871.1 helix-turn-helix transcriptional regulator [Methylobacterium organophilum]MBP2496123.1 AraC-like DNA-binding protein [Methylobacterium sp. PvP105]
MSEALEIAHGAFGRVALLDMDRSLVRHAHPHCHVLLKVEGDDTQFLVGDQVVALTDDQAVLINAWETHAYLHDPRRAKAMILALYIEPNWLGAFRRNWAASGAPGFFGQPSGAVTPTIHRLAHDLAAEMVYAPLSSHIQDELLSNLMVAVIERFTAWREEPLSLRAAARRNAGDWRIRRTIARVRAEPGAMLGTEALAREAGLSRAQFYRLFEQSTGAPPHVFLNAIRIEQAVEAIVSSEEPLTAIGMRLGFAAPAHFSRFFRDHVSVPPSIFRGIVRRGGQPTA